MKRFTTNPNQVINQIPIINGPGIQQAQQISELQDQQQVQFAVQQPLIERNLQINRPVNQQQVIKQQGNRIPALNNNSNNFNLNQEPNTYSSSGLFSPQQQNQKQQIQKQNGCNENGYQQAQNSAYLTQDKQDKFQQQLEQKKVKQQQEKNYIGVQDDDIILIEDNSNTNGKKQQQNGINQKLKQANKENGDLYKNKNNEIQLKERTDKEDISQFSSIFFKLKQVTDEFIKLDITKSQKQVEAIIKTEDDKDKLKEQKTVQQNFGKNEVEKSEQYNKEYEQYKNKILITTLVQIGDLKKFFYPQISFENYKKVQSIFTSKPSTQEYVKHDHISESLTINNLKTLQGANWLNDMVINAYLALIKQSLLPSVKLYNTYFYENFSGNAAVKQNFNWHKIMRIVKKDHNKFDVTQDRVYIPINQNGNHWVFIEINCLKKEILYYDSFNKSIQTVQQQLNPIKEMITKIQVEQQKPIVQFSIGIGKQAHQENCSDCGVFMLKGIQYLGFGKEISFDQQDIQYFRYLICLELIEGKLLGQKI